jgi:hypothetical protein
MPRSARVHRSVRSAPWSLCAVSVGPTPSHVVRARWPRRAARAPPLACRSLHVVPGPCPCRASPCRAAALTGPSRTASTYDGYKSRLSPRLVRDTEPHRGHHCRRRRAPCSARARCHPSTPKASSHTQRACTPACCLSRTTCSPEYDFQWSPPSSRRRVPLPTRSPGQPTLPGPPLGRREANCATRCAAPSLSSPESEQPRPPSPISAAPACRTTPTLQSVANQP